MRLLLSIGYTKILFGKGAAVSEILAAIDGAKQVEEKGGWNEPKRYEIGSDAEIEFKIIQDDDVMLPDVSDDGMFEKFHKVAQERDDAAKEVRELKSQLEAIKKAAEGE